MVDNEIDSVVIAPQSSQRLAILSDELGVRFSWRDAEKEYRSIIIPDQEIEDFIMTLFAAPNGRTSVQSLRNVLDSLS